MLYEFDAFVMSVYVRHASGKKIHDDSKKQLDNFIKAILYWLAILQHSLGHLVFTNINT